MRQLSMPTPEETTLFVYTVPPISVLEGIHVRQMDADDYEDTGVYSFGISESNM